MNFLQRARQLLPEMMENRRWLHQHPETGFALEETTVFVQNKLVEMGYRPEPCGKSGVTATIGRPGKTMLLRADMDALPMREESGLSFASHINCAHTCGHDLHTAILLGAAKMLREQEHLLQGTVKLMFQPAEELLEGAKSMIAHGVLEHPVVDAAIGLHMMPLAPTGFIFYNAGTVSAASDSFRITIHGKGGHGAQPDRTVDPINVAAHLHIALQELVSREVGADEAVVLTVGTLQAGSSHNIIPETAVMSGTLRTFNPDIRRFVLQRIQQMAETVAVSFRATARAEVFASTGSVLVNPELAELVMESCRELVGSHTVVRADGRVNESEDFSEISTRVPSLFFLLGAGSQEEGYRYGLHNPKVIFNEEAMPVGAAVLANSAVEWLSAREFSAVPLPAAGCVEEIRPYLRRRTNTGWRRTGMQFTKTTQ